MHRTSLIVALLVLAALATTALAQNVRGPSDWPTAAPAAQGVNGLVLDSLDREIARGAYGNVDRMVVIHRGALIYDRRYAHNYDSIYADSARTRGALNSSDMTGPYNYYNAWWHPTYRRGTLHTLQSVTKTVASVIIGVAVSRGDFPGIDTPVLKFFDTTKVANIDDRKRRVTVRHLLTMSGGFDWNENLPYTDPKNTASQLEESADWVKFTIDRPMARDPGTLFNYSSGESELLAHIFRRATGVDIEEYAARHLFAPLGITQWHWKRIPTGLIDTEGGLYLDATDLARIWQLFLNDGMWHGQRVVSADWVRQSVTPALRTADRPGAPWYGLKWWLRQNPVDTDKLVWAGSGFGGQFPLAFPERDLVVVFNSWNILPVGNALPLNTTMARIARAVPLRK